MPSAVTAKDKKYTVLVAEDEPAIVTLIKYNLEKQGFNVITATDGEEALYQVKAVQPDLVLLDWMMPLLSGIEVCRQIRAHKTTATIPIIMITARGEESDKVHGLNFGADDYLVKPFSPNELIARINAVLRRAKPNLQQNILEYQDFKIDQDTVQAWRNGRLLNLNPTEFRLLVFFASHPLRVFSRTQLLDQVWGTDVYVEPRTVDVHIRRLRKAINIDGESDPIRTVRSSGYAFGEA